MTAVAAGEIRAEDVSRVFRVRARDTQTLKELLVARGRGEGHDVQALRDVSVAVAPGEAVGLIGRNGSGKTTLLRIVAGIIRPTTGRIAAGGRIGSLLELGAGFHPDFTGRENVFLNGSLQGLRRRQIAERFDEIVAFAELEDAIDRPVRTYSSGMYMRLGFAIAAFLEADILLLDEVFAVGDEAFQRKCFARIAEFKQRGGTIVFVSHDAAAVERLCERAVLLRSGEVIFDGAAREAILRYRRGLAEETDPAERGAGLREWGTGEATIASARLLGRDGVERGQFLAGSRCPSRSRSRCTSVCRRRCSRSSFVTRRACSSQRTPSTRVRWAGTGRVVSAPGSTSRRCRSRTGVSSCGSAWPPPTASTSCTGATTRSRSSSTRTAKAEGWCGSKEPGPAPRTTLRDELPDVPRLA